MGNILEFVCSQLLLVPIILYIKPILQLKFASTRERDEDKEFSAFINQVFFDTLNLVRASPKICITIHNLVRDSS